MLTHSIKGDTLVVQPTGELDHHSAVAIREEIDALIDGHKGIKKLVFDLKELSFMDSSGIGVVIGRYKRMSSRGGSVVVKEPRRNIERIFAMSGIYQIVQKA